MGLLGLLGFGGLGSVLRVHAKCIGSLATQEPQSGGYFSGGHQFAELSPLDLC